MAKKQGGGGSTPQNQKRSAQDVAQSAIGDNYTPMDLGSDINRFATNTVKDVASIPSAIGQGADAIMSGTVSIGDLLSGMLDQWSHPVEYANEHPGFFMMDLLGALAAPDAIASAGRYGRAALDEGLSRLNSGGIPAESPNFSRIMNAERSPAYGGNPDMYSDGSYEQIAQQLYDSGNYDGPDPSMEQLLYEEANYPSRYADDPYAQNALAREYAVGPDGLRDVHTEQLLRGGLDDAAEAEAQSGFATTLQRLIEEETGGGNIGPRDPRIRGVTDKIGRGNLLNAKQIRAALDEMRGQVSAARGEKPWEVAEEADLKATLADLAAEEPSRIDSGYFQKEPYSRQFTDYIEAKDAEQSRLYNLMKEDTYGGTHMKATDPHSRTAIGSRLAVPEKAPVNEAILGKTKPSEAAPELVDTVREMNSRLQGPNSLPRRKPHWWGEGEIPFDAYGNRNRGMGAAPEMGDYRAPSGMWPNQDQDLSYSRMGEEGSGSPLHEDPMNYDHAAVGMRELMPPDAVRPEPWEAYGSFDAWAEAQIGSEAPFTPPTSLEKLLEVLQPYGITYEDILDMAMPHTGTGAFYQQQPTTLQKLIQRALIEESGNRPGALMDVEGTPRLRPGDPSGRPPGGPGPWAEDYPSRFGPGEYEEWRTQHGL